MFFLALTCAPSTISTPEFTPASGPIADQYIIELNQANDISPFLSEFPEAQVLHQLNQRPILVVQVPNQDEATLATHPLVKHIEQDQAVSVTAPVESTYCGTSDQYTPGGVARIGTPTGTGAGIRVGVIDTGIDSNHEDLIVSGSWNFSTAASAEDVYGHGTHVAGTIAAQNNAIGVVGVAPEVDLYSFKVLNDSGSGSMGTVVAGVDAAVAEGMDVINLSLGGSGESLALQESIANAWNSGVVVVVAAGNNGSPTRGFIPASYDESAITVSAWSIKEEAFALWSNYGPEVDIAAPGVVVCSSTPGDTYSVFSGTSMATPHVAGAAALFLEANPSATPDEVSAGLEATQEALHGNKRHPEGLVRVDSL